MSSNTNAFRSFAVPNYRIWFAGATVSNVGTWMQRTAQDWLVLQVLTHQDAFAVGITMALQFAPQLLLTPLTGLAADLFNRRKLLIATQSVMGALALLLGLLTLTGVAQLWMVYVFALVLGIASAFDAPVRQTFVSELVPPAYLSNAVALNGTSFNVARLVGPAVAGLLVAAVGSGWVFLINAASFAGVIGAMFALRTRELTPSPRARRQTGQVRAGFAYLGTRNDLILVFILVFLMGTFGMNFPLYVSTMASVEFHYGAEVFGILSSVIAVGSITGALLAARREKPRLRLVAIASGGFGITVGLAALAPNVWLYAVALAVVGVFSVTMLNSANAFVQTTTPPTLRGRIMSMYMAIVMGGTLIGAPFVGWVANEFGPRWGMSVGAISGVLGAVIGLVWWIRTRRARLRWDATERWPLRLEATRPVGVRQELATTEIAVVETQTQKG